MVNYQNGKVYKIEPICDHEENEIYIGSTTKTYLSQRMDSHRNKYKLWKQDKTNYITAFDLFEKYGIVNCEIFLIENCPCETKDELRVKEGHYIRTTKCVNKAIPNRSKKEYYKDNKSIFCEKARTYRIKNIDQIIQYRVAHKERAKETNKEYHEKHRESLLLKMKERGKIKYQCKCGSICRKPDKSSHEKSKKHQKYITNNQINPVDPEIAIDV